MILDRKHLPWAVLVLAGTVFTGALYLANFHPGWLPIPIPLPPFFGPVPPLHGTVGGTPLGILYGLAAFLIFIFAAMLGSRKKKRLWRVGNVQGWLRAHIWLSIFTIPLVIFHSGFRLGGPMTTYLVILYGIVMVSGFVGLALQQVLPRLITARLTQEVVFEQIPYLRTVLIENAETLRNDLQPEKKAEPKPAAAPPPKVAPKAAASAPAAAVAQSAPATSPDAKPATPPPAAAAASTPAPAPVAAPAAAAIPAPPPKPAPPAAAPGKPDEAVITLTAFLNWEVLPYLRARRGGGFRLGTQYVSDELFRQLKINLSPQYYEKVDEMRSWCDDRRQMDLQTRMHHWMHGWLFIHVPLSFLLIVITVWHAVVTLYVI